MKEQAFSNITEFASWRSLNCDICGKDWNGKPEDNDECDIEEELAWALIDDGKVEEGLLKRANILPYDGKLKRCSEFVEEG